MDRSEVITTEYLYKKTSIIMVNGIYLIQKMRKIFIASVIALLLMLCSNAVQAQSSQINLNQAELLRKYIGTWKAEVGKDTTRWFEFSFYGENALVGSFKIKAQDKIIYQNKQMWGYDNRSEKIIGVELEKKSGTMTYYLCRFISENIFEGAAIRDITHPDIVSEKFYEEFKSPDMYIQSFTQNSRKISITFKRIK